MCQLYLNKAGKQSFPETFCTENNTISKVKTQIKN